MALSRPFSYNNTGLPISGTTQYGDLVVGNIEADYAAGYGGVTWWGGPDEDLRYIIGNVRPGGQPVPSGVTETAYVGFWGTPLGDKTEAAFLNLANYVGGKNGQPPFANVNDAVVWLESNGFYTSYNTVTPSPTPTNTPTPSVTNTQTPSVTPTLTPTPSTSPIPVTGYSFNLVALPYNFPSSGNTIMNGAGGETSGTTDPNVLATGSRGIYWNSIDSDGIDRTNYFSQFTGQSITITMTQTGSTAIYSGDTNSLKQWIQVNTGFVFGAGIGVPPSNTPSGTAVLIQSASTQWTLGLPVYISAVIN
jgi:hypothetical protein